MPTKTVGCSVSVMGRIDIPAGCKPYHPPGNPKATDGFIMPDGRIVRPIMMFEVEDSTGNFSEPTGSDLEDMGILGAGELDQRAVYIQAQE